MNVRSRSNPPTSGIRLPLTSQQRTDTALSGVLVSAVPGIGAQGSARVARAGGRDLRRDRHDGLDCEYGLSVQQSAV